MNPFERFDIKHLSPSSLNTYGENPSMWVAQYLFGKRSPTNAAMARGAAIETGLDYWLFQQHVDPAAAEHAQSIAAAKFAEITGGQCDEAHDVERALVAPCLDQAMKATAGWSVPLARQLKIEHYVNGVEVPVIGYLDYIWPDFVLDLKSSKQCPSSIKGEHGRQFSVYATVKHRPCKGLYVTAKKSAVLQLSEIEQAKHLRDLERQARAVRHLLARSRDRDDAKGFFAPNPDSFRHSDEIADQLWKEGEAA